MTENEKIFLQVNILKNRYLTDGNIWTIDETIFNIDTKLFMIINLKTRAILGYILHQSILNEELIIELYQKLFNQYNNPIVIHSDMEPAFSSTLVRNFLKKEGVEISSTTGAKNQNQVSESINERIKALVTLELVKKDSKSLRDWRKNIPSDLKGMSNIRKSKTKKFRELLFVSAYFQQKRFEVIPAAIAEYNKKHFSAGISLAEAEYYNSKIVPKTKENFQLVQSNDLLGEKIKKENIKSIQNVEKNLRNIICSTSETDQKITQIAGLLVQGQSQTQELVKRGFAGIAIQNAELFNQNEELKQQLADMQTKFDLVFDQLQEKIDQEHLIKKKRLERKSRKLQPIRQPVTKEIYEILISESEVILYESKFRGTRLRLALVLLLVTGIRISELLPLKLYQIKTLFVEHWIEIDRAKRGPSNHKAFLTKEGANIVRKRLSDLEIMSSYKTDNCYIFTAQGSNKPLDREAFNRIINQFIKKCALKIPGKPNLKSHSFRIGFITQLWRDTNDIEFVRQAIGHAKINTTSEYVENLSDEERRSKMEQVKSPKDLVRSLKNFDNC